MLKAKHITIGTFLLGVGFVLVVSLMSCNRSSTKHLTMEDTQYVITFEEDYNVKGFISMYDDRIDEISKTSKTHNSYLVKFKEQIEIKSINTLDAVVEIKVHEVKIESPTTHKAEKGKSAPINIK